MLADTGEMKTDIASPWTITLGDEFQAVYKGAGTLFADIMGIMAQIHPVLMRVSIGVDVLTTSLNPDQALGMDGPAFHKARQAMTNLKRDKNRLIYISGDDIKQWVLPNLVLELISRRVRKWDSNRFKILARLMRTEPQDIKNIADELGISQTAVYKNIRNAMLPTIVKTCNNLAEKLDETLRQE